MKNIIKILFSVLMVLAFASCGNNGDGPIEPNKPVTGGGGEDKPVLTEDLTFTFEVIEVDATTAKIKVSNNGTTTDSWYGFATTNSNVKEAISEKYNELTANETISGLKKQTSYTATVSGLEPETEYNYIAFGITSEGELYGNPSSVKFTTARGEVEMEKNAAWTVAYNGAAEINGTTYEHTITVTSTDKNKYFISAYDKETFETSDIKLLAEAELAYLKEVVAYYQQEPGYEKITIQDMLFEGNGMDAMNLTPGDWYGIAIGVDANGELSGLYAAAPFTIEEEEATEAYASWIGNWTWTGSNGVAWDVTIDKGINNNLYYLSGWEGPETSKNVEIPMMWDAENEVWAILTTNYGTFNFGEDGDGEVWILGAQNTGNIYPIENLPICIGGITEDGQRACISYTEEMEDGSMFSFDYMMYIAAIGDMYYMLSRTEAWPTFPIVITPSETAAQASVKEEIKGTQKFTQAPKPLKTYYQSYMNAIVR